MVPHSSTLAWKIPWTEEPGGLQSMGLRRVGHYWVTSLSLFTLMHWRRKWQPTPVFLPGESQGQKSLVGCPSLGSHRVGHDWSDLAAAAAAENLLISEKAFFRWVLVLKILWCIYIKYIYMYYISKCYREFPGGLVVRVWHFHCHG